MSDINCNACDDLRKDAASFVQNGVTKTVCNSMKNDTGINPKLSVLHTDCEDLDTANDCLVGRMGSDLETYDSCDWKKFMHRFIPNLYNFLKLIVCTLCGIWTNIHSLTSRVEKLECLIKYAMSGATFEIGEEVTGNAYAVAGKGVSFLTAHVGDVHAGDLRLMYVAGGLMRATGSYKFYKDDFTDEMTVGNFDNGSAYRESKSRKGNSVWNTTGRTATGGELICEFRVKKSAYPQIKQIFMGCGQETGGGAYHTISYFFNEGSYAFGQHGWCDENTGAPLDPSFDSGHRVPSGWFYVQIRMTNISILHPTGVQYSPLTHMGVRMNEQEIDC